MLRGRDIVSCELVGWGVEDRILKEKSALRAS